ncbi:hypothetical protein [Leifsonia poae]|uniref:DUF4386 domain-containing protein n=1 Tax=Leifsonia poae TaxID=110933 RepID=A0A9W6H717_9MICO|nr:hypothetical protein [Leifsonia poae]GLJ75109.1 hypothetical protein GCM10017584_06820 [Leifsonia poae]
MNAMTSSGVTPEKTRRRSGGPHLGALAIVTAGLVALGLILGVVLSGGTGFVSPFAGSEAVAAYAQSDWLSIRISAMIQFGSAVPLGILAATAWARLQRLGVRVPGPGIGFFGGITASLLLMVSAFASYVLSRPEVSSDPSVALALSFLAFVTGGVGYATGLGLLLAGIAVPSLILHLLPRWLSWTGLVIAALAELSFLSLAIEPLQFLLPIGRFGGLLWLIAAGFLLPTDRREVRDRDGAPNASVAQAGDPS